jgi:hypothetical protein
LVKLGKAFSIVAVLTLLILLAPAVILAPVGSVAAAGDNVTEEIEATFNFSVVSGGQWGGFTAGSGGLQNGTSGVPRLALVQYTRPNVVKTTTLAGCGFRNYTTGSGSVASTVGNLTGTMTLEWIAFRFNQTYNKTPIYMTATNFGWMAGRGHYYDTGNASNNFTFVFVADLDCNGDMTVAAGKGFIYSVEENGRFGNMANPTDLRCKIIGDFDIALSGGTYSGNFHLRNYPPDEVYDSGVLNVTGGVMQEWTDNIAPQVELLNVTSDGSMFTPYDTLYQPGFEEIDWGKDPGKTVNYSVRLGVNATMDLTRDSALYLNQSVGAPNNTTYITIQANPVCILHINDTYAVTGSDHTAYGELWEFLILSLPLQKLALHDYFNQTGYTFCPFGTVNGQPTSGTGCYAGTESCADAKIAIESSVGNSLQSSTDNTYGLFPHPKVTSVSPPIGMNGTTQNVTIKGRYFLRAAGEKSGLVPNSGSVDFGAGITVNSYSFKNSSPIDNEIRVSITIAANATNGARVVNVTSCFGYDGTGAGNGTAPYESGYGAFNVSNATGTLSGHVDLKRKAAAGCTTWVTPLLVRFFDPSTKTEMAWSNINVTTDVWGNFNATGVGVGIYDVAVKNFTCLSRMVVGQTFSAGNTTTVNFNTSGVTTGVLIESDTDNNDQIVLNDYNRVLTKFGLGPLDPGWNAMYDFDRSGLIDLADFNLVLTKYGQLGNIYSY